MTLSTTPRPGRNEPCPCGSGRKYKQCCLAKDEAASATARATAAAEGGAVAGDTPAAAAPAIKHQTQQPWKGATSRGFVPRSRTPRKMGGG
jgi:hypothetical protein